MSYVNVTNTANYQLQALGQKGFRKINSTFTPVAGEYYRAFMVMSDAVVSATAESGDSLSFETVLTGTIIYGLFSSIVVESGAVIAYIA